MKQIIKLLPKDQQTTLFSATQTTKVEDLARVSFWKAPKYIGVDDGRSKVWVNQFSTLDSSPPGPSSIVSFPASKSPRHNRLSDQNNHDFMTKARIIGITVAAFLTLIAGILIIVFFATRKHNKHETKENPRKEHEKPRLEKISYEDVEKELKFAHSPIQISRSLPDLVFTRQVNHNAEGENNERNALPTLKAYEQGVSSSAIRNAKDLTDSVVPSPLTQVPNLPTEKTIDGSDAEVEADNKEKKPSNVIVQAVLKKIKQGPKKVNLVAALVRGMLVEDALLQMQVLVKRAALSIYKTIKSARVNAVHNKGLNLDRLIIVEAFVGKGRYLKRIWPHAKGRHGIRERKSCMLTVKVREMTPEEEEHRALIQTNCFKKLSKTQRRLVPHQLIETQWQWHRKPKRSPPPTSQAN